MVLVVDDIIVSFHLYCAGKSSACTTRSPQVRAETSGNTAVFKVKGTADVMDASFVREVQSILCTARNYRYGRGAVIHRKRGPTML